VRAESATLQSANSTEICVTTSPLGMSADALSGLLSVAPNPSAGEFTIRLTDAPAGLVRLSVVDALGRVVEQSSLTAVSAAALTHNLDLRSKAEGVYTLRLTLADGRTAVRRLVKM
jgi:HEAT repeat protein